jgi:Flp pilus assembly CpaE family ATPase
MLRIDEAERFAAAARNRVREGEEAIAALKWLSEHGGSVNLTLNCHEASGCKGHREAMAYLNIEVRDVLAEILQSAKMRAQTDMDRCLGKAAS